MTDLLTKFHNAKEISLRLKFLPMVLLFNLFLKYTTDAIKFAK